MLRLNFPIKISLITVYLSKYTLYCIADFVCTEVIVQLPFSPSMTALRNILSTATPHSC